MDDKSLLDVLAAMGTGLALVSSWVIWRIRSRVIKTIFVVIAAMAILVGVGAFGISHRPLPNDEQRVLFQSIDYARIVRLEPVPVVIHIVRIDLQDERLQFFVTPRTPTGEYEQTARTTSRALKEFRLQVAINGDFFDPSYDYGFFSYYPHVGDGINLYGASVANGQRVTNGYADDFQTLSIDANHQVTIADEPLPDAQVAISGYLTPVRDGQIGITINDTRSIVTDRFPRTAIGVDRLNRTLYLFVIDGRQPNYSEGVTLPELAQIMIEVGVYQGLNLDGGGSSTLVIEGDNGEPMVLNSPIHGRLPGLERPVGNHFGLYAARIGNP
ncbi:MAG: phosphodiester glycosidase family protein [Anaerolineae bacterium]